MGYCTSCLTGWLLPELPLLQFHHMQIHKKFTVFTPGGIQYMESLWIAYCRITYVIKREKKNSEDGTPENIDDNDKNYDYRFQSFNGNIPEEHKDTAAKLKYLTNEFKKGIVKSQAKANKQNDVDIVCIMNVKRKRTTGIKNEFLEIEVWDCQIYEEEDSKRKEKTLGVITTDISSLDKDIEKMALMGSGITRNGFKTVSKIIEVNYPLIKPETTKGWGKSGHKSREKVLSLSILYFHDIYTEYSQVHEKKDNTKDIQEDNISNTQKETANRDKNILYIKDDNYFYIPSNKFTEIYNGMEIQEYLDIKDYKKYLKDNGYIKTNKNRYDYTNAQIGKCIAFEIKKLLEEAANKDDHVTETG